MNKYIYFLLLSLVAICPIAAMEPIDGLHNGMAHAAPKGSPDKKRKSSAAPEQLETKVSRTAQQEYAIPAAAEPQPDYDDFFDELPPLASTTPTHNAQFMEEEFEQEMESPCAQSAVPTLNKKRTCRCNKSFRKATALKDHIMAVHLNIKPYQCPALGCNHSDSQNSNLMVHIKAMHADLGDLKPIPLSRERKDEINKLIVEFQNSTQELPEKEHEIQKTCTCGKSFRYVKDLHDHIVAAHLKIKSYRCPASECNYSSAHRSNLKAHTKARHAALGNLKSIPLSQEQKDEINKLIAEFQNSAQNLTEVEQEMEDPSTEGTAPTSNKQHICTCNKSFQKASLLKNHIMAVHLKIKPYQCPAPGCDHSTTQNFNLVEHIKRKHADLGDLKPAPLSQEKDDEINRLIQQFKNQNSTQK